MSYQLRSKRNAVFARRAACDCPWLSRPRGIVNHTPQCLRETRGDLPVDLLYAPPAPKPQ